MNLIISGILKSLLNVGDKLSISAAAGNKVDRGLD